MRLLFYWPIAISPVGASGRSPLRWRSMTIGGLSCDRDAVGLLIGLDHGAEILTIDRLFFQ